MNSNEREHASLEEAGQGNGAGAGAGAGLLFHRPAKKTQLINPVVLAYVGDSVFELLVRQYLVSLPNHKSHHLHKEATKIVSAKAQRKLLEKWQPMLTEEEADIVRRGRNTKSGAPPKNADPADYRQATALECLVGYLYYEGRIERLHELFEEAVAPQPEDYQEEKEGQA
ncbi:ribonuclease III domain-containing protein [Paenibacillus sp. ATY16]|uniref:Mini-ribonuclease 3 n=1 Tax=Paenibacillus sp. ATY16 TaxID=1759312 RepID=UPI00200CE94B|nr:ribonuclease III domain-containing protein [Paenibacillus sp. ATY16]MCK9862638.1 ribonuclease III [Paenibacillus sp. ATY16]